MSDLQIVLIVIGGVIIAAVLIFNWWQERRFHQQVESSFSSIKSDALLEEPSLDSINHVSAENELEHDDFSISHDFIEETPVAIEDPAIEITDDFDEATDFEPETAHIPEADETITAVEPPANNVSTKSSTPYTETKSTNHDGIKAIFQDAFNKNLNPGTQETNANKEQSQVNEVKPEVPAQSLPAMLHAQVDLIALLHLATESTVDQIVKAFKDDLDAYDKPVFMHVQTPDLRWLLLSDVSSKSEFADQKISKITCALQLADRAGAISRSAINRFQLAVESLGLDINAHVEWLSTGDPAADAEALDAFCIDVDKTMGFHLVHGDNGAFTGTKLRGLAEAQGLDLSADGTFKYFDEAAKKQATSGLNPPTPSFVMFNREHYPFSPEMLRSSVVKGITFQLDIPHVSNATEAYNHMVLIAKQMETGLHAQLVDDNNRPLGDTQIEKIRHQLKIIQATMLTRGIIPGSDVAHRLFS